MSHKSIAKKFLETVARGNVQEGYDKFVAENFIHHNQYFKGDRQTLLDAMAESNAQEPNKVFAIKQIVEEGDRVWTYSYVEKEKMKIAVVHIMRFEHGKIAEMWDVGMLIDPNGPNEHGAF